MRDPYDILGITRRASFDEIRAAYRRACKSAHPDMAGGSNEKMVELNTAYAFILSELKKGYAQQQQDAKQQQPPEQEEAWQDVGSPPPWSDEERVRHWRKAYRDIDDELEELRRATQDHEDRLREMRRMAWNDGHRVAWAKLTFEDFVRFFRGIARSGVKGLSLLFTALIGVGSVLVEANAVSAFIVIGSGLGFILSLALKSDKGGLMSAGLLLFGLMTIWLPPVRAALYTFPGATISVLLCIALIFKFAREGGRAGLMTGGVLALYVIFVITNDTGKKQVAVIPQARAPIPAPELSPAPPIVPEPVTQEASAPVQKSALSPVPQTRPQPVPVVLPLPTPVPVPPPEERTLIASDGAVLKFSAGVVYHVRARSGFTTVFVASSGAIALYENNKQIGDCLDHIAFAFPEDISPYQEMSRTIRSCVGDTILRVESVRRAN